MRENLRTLCTLVRVSKLLANNEDAFQACRTYAVYRRVAFNRKNRTRNLHSRRSYRKCCLRRFAQNCCCKIAILVACSSFIENYNNRGRRWNSEAEMRSTDEEGARVRIKRGSFTGADETGLNHTTLAATCRKKRMFRVHGRVKKRTVGCLALSIMFTAPVITLGR